MAAKRIGIFGNFVNPDVQALKAKVEDRGSEARIIDLDLFPNVVRASIETDRLMFDGMNLLEFDAFYARRIGSMWSFPEIRFSREEWVEQYERFNDTMADIRANLAFRLSLVRILCDCKLVINPYEAWGYHQLKPHQYRVLAKNGFKVPNFLAGNDYFELRKFLEKARTVEKPPVTGPVRKVGCEELEAQREKLRSKPTMYQRFIEGKSIRAFVLGEEVIVACELPRKTANVDASDEIEHMRKIELPKKLEREIVRAAKTLNMIFSGVDLQLEESSGEYYFLECNSAPFFSPYDAQVEADIGGKLAEYLIEHS